MSEKRLMEVINGIKELDKNAIEKANARVNDLAKPLGSLGALEEVAVRLSGITGKVKNEFEKRCIIVMCADNGVYEENVSACPQNITMTQTLNFLKGTTGVGVLAKRFGADLKVIDIGINGDLPESGVINKKIKYGTDNMVKGPAMTRAEAVSAIMVGVEAVREAVEAGYTMLGTGEMGICNTTTSSAILMAFAGMDADEVVGRGAGLSDEWFDNKKNAIRKSISINSPNPEDGIDVLHKVGGLDIAGLVGCFIGAAYYRVPVVIDGFISSAAALTAYKICPQTRDFMFASHASAEPGYSAMISEIGHKPFFDLGMRLGEGSGCPLAFSVIDASCAIMNEMDTFSEAAIDEGYLENAKSFNQ